MADQAPASGIDHAILAVRDLEDAAATWRDLLGFHVSGGGTHPAFGTANRIVVLGDDYIELISATPQAEADSWLRRRVLAVGEGCAGFALATPDPASAAAALNSRGIAAEGPTPGRLDAGPFGRGWHSVGFDGLGAASMPFLIRHEAQGEERRRQLAGSGGLREHPIGARAIAHLTVAVRDLAESTARYEATYRLQPQQPQEDPMLAAATVRLPLPSGAAIVLAAPLRQGHGPVAAALALHGEGLFALTIAVDDLPAAVRTLRGRGIGVRVDEPGGVLAAAQLDHRRTHEARIGLVARERGRRAQ